MARDIEVSQMGMTGGIQKYVVRLDITVRTDVKQGTSKSIRMITDGVSAYRVNMPQRMLAQQHRNELWLHPVSVAFVDELWGLSVGRCIAFG